MVVFPELPSRFTLQIYLADLHCRFTLQIYLADLHCRFTLQIYTADLHCRFTLQSTDKVNYENVKKVTSKFDNNSLIVPLIEV